MAEELGVEDPQHHHGGGEEDHSTVEEHPDSSNPTATLPPDKGFPTVSIWPPSQRTRDAVIHRLLETLSSPSVLSKRYGTVPADEAAAAAALIEQDAFSAAAAADGGRSSTIDGGIEVLQIYSKEISKKMLELVKAREAPASDASVTAESLVRAESDPPTAVATDEDSSVKSEALDS